MSKNKYSYIGVIFTLIGVTLVSYLYTNQFQKEVNNDISFIEHINSVSNNAEIILNEETPHKATIKLSNIKKEDKEIKIVLTVMNKNTRLESTIKNLEISGKTKDSVVRTASFPDGAKKTTLLPYEITTVDVTVKVKEDIKEMSFDVSFEVD